VSLHLYGVVVAVVVVVAVAAAAVVVVMHSWQSFALLAFAVLEYHSM